MSSTNRGGQRSPADYYITPAWCVERLLEVLELPGGPWLEPAAGDGAIIRAVRRRDIDWTAWELRNEERAVLVGAVPPTSVHIGDFLEASRAGKVRPKEFEVAITNPPFRLAQEFIDAGIRHARTTIMLLRLNYLASKARWPFMTTRAPDVYVLPNRPSFVGGKTDSVEYAWFVWSQERRTSGRIRVLGLRG
jgi:hypothetical protein